MTQALVEESQLLTKSCTESSLEKDDCILENFSLIQNESQPIENKLVAGSYEQPTDDDEQSDEFFDCDSEQHDDSTKGQNIVDKDINESCSCKNNIKTNIDEPYINGSRKNLYPYVVVNPSHEAIDIDSDEEDYQLRMCRNNDSGQGSSVETSSIKSTTHESFHVETITDTSQNNSRIKKDDTKSKLDNNIIDVLQDIDLSAEPSLPVHRTSSFISRNIPEGNAKITNSNFTDIPLNPPSPSKMLNTYTPPKNSSDHIDGLSHEHPFKAPAVMDTPPKTGLPKRSHQKSWKVFGKVVVPVSVNPSLKTSPGSLRKQKKETVGSSTTALILENRPAHLPPKLPKEEQRHREQYAEMIALAKRKELRDQENEKKKLKERRKLEDQLSNVVKVWKEEIIPNWQTCKNSKKVRDLWWNGVPPSVRGVVWSLAIGNDLHMTPELFVIFQEHAKERSKMQRNVEPINSVHNSESSLVVSKENTIGLISLDVSRTFPALCIFQKGGPYHEPLKTLLAAYTCHRPDVGYVQGMSFLAAMLLLNMDLTDAFICFTNLLSRSCQMAFFTVNQALMEAYYRTFDVLLEEQLPRVHMHFRGENLSHDIYLIDWIFTLFSKSLPLDTACRVWDLFCRDGEEFLFRTALGILLMHEEALLEMEFFRLAQYLTKLSNTITADELFQYIEKINFSKSKFQQTLQSFKSRAKSYLPT